MSNASIFSTEKHIIRNHRLKVINLLAEQKSNRIHHFKYIYKICKLFFKIGICLDQIQILAPFYQLNNNSKRSMSKQPVITLTGFKQNQEQYKQYIIDLKMRIATYLSQQTSVLVVNDTTTQKYKIALEYEPPKKCVVPDWLKDSKKQKKILPTDNYPVKIFHGATVIIFDYTNEMAKKIDKIITENGGRTSIINSAKQLQDLIQNQINISVVLTTKSQYKKLTPHLQNFNFSIVDIEWLQDSIRAKRCKYPQDYGLNLVQMKTKQSVCHLKKMKQKLSKYLGLELRPTDQETQILQNTIIYISDNVDRQLANVLKKFIMLCGGLYLEHQSPIITHILTDPVTQNQYIELKTYGCLVFILRIEWLIDTIYVHKKLSQQDYMIRSFKKMTSTTLFQDKGNNSISLNNNSRKTISMPVSAPSISKQISIKMKYSGHIFKNQCFYIESSQKGCNQLFQLAKKIESNEGTLFKTKKQINKSFYYILADSPENQKLVKQMCRFYPNIQIQPMSFRWINECCAKQDFIKHDTQSYIFKPFNFRTPIPNFHQIVIEVVGADAVQKMRLKELYNSLGSTKNSPNKAQITHCLCVDNFANHPRLKEIQQQKKCNLKYVDWRWLVDSAKQGKIIDVDKYIVDLVPQDTSDTKSLSAT